MGFVTIVGNGVLISALLHFKRQPYADLFHASPNSIAATLAIVSLPTLMTVPGVLAVMTAVQSLVLILFPMSSSDELMFDRMMTGSVGTVLVVCLIGPVVEEMLFRGIMLRSFLNQYSRITAIVLSAAIFGAAHLNVYQFFAGLCTGILLGWLYERTQSLWPCILFHVAYNSTLTLLASAFVEGESKREASWSVLLLLGAIIIGGVGVWLLRRTLEPRGR
jgi:uncharacterized protein